MAAPTPRSYDIVVLGATGYTATIIAEYITETLPTDFKWAVAGRSERKLVDLVKKLKKLDPSRQEPSIEVLELEQEPLKALSSKSRLIINGIGPYHLYSTPVVAACAYAGTHYIGFSLETPWIQEIIKKYHDIAKSNGSIIIPTIALAPSDIVGYLVASKTSERAKNSVIEVNSTAQLELQGMSGGSLNTVLSLMSTYGISWILPGNPWSLTNIPQPFHPSSAPLLSKLFGYKNIPGLGIVTTSFLAICNESIAHRSASLQLEVYGENFRFHEYLPVPNMFAAIFVHFLTRLGLLLFALPPFRWLFQRLIPAAGTGPDLAKANNEKQTFVAIGTQDPHSGRKTMARFVYEGSLYWCSAMMGVEAALIVLGDEVTPAHKFGGGILTPSMLGMPFIERVRKGGVEIEVDTV